ncbi:MAG: sialidase family protein [Victivallaceae bacterium]|nr:sialidase family protein [Victivallaceae bacterium]
MKIMIDFHPEQNKEYALADRLWQGAPSLAITPKGTLYATWYSGGTHEPCPNNYQMLSRSTDHGLHFSDPMIVFKSAPENKTHIVECRPWGDPDGRLWIFWSERYYTDQEFYGIHTQSSESWAIICDDPDAEILRWGSLRKVVPGFILNSPMRLSSGEWLLCTDRRES